MISIALLEKFSPCNKKMKSLFLWLRRGLVPKQSRSNFFLNILKSFSHVQKLLIGPLKRLNLK